MEFKEVQKGCVNNAIRYGKEYNVEIDEDFALLKLYEEVGEFTQSILIHRKKSRPEKFLPEKESKREVAKELADVVGFALLNADLLGIDMIEALKDKQWL
jgi:NTP pyrophosphatase (non-canonical NTP hydrolase)